ncbi:MAG: FixH family protein [Balneolaceae bacterium]|nr:FixH family protein [Balneolaceae bacterium]
MKLFKQSLKAIACTLFVIYSFNCDSTEVTSEPDFNLINTTEVEGYTVQLFSESNFITGGNTLYWSIKKDGKTAELRSFSVTPMMDMGMMQHSTPYTQPKAYDEFPAYYTNDATFIMPSGEMGTWDIKFTMVTMADEEISGSIDITVDSSWHLTSVKDSNDQMYFISWNTPRNPTSGSNDIVIMLYKRETMMSFPMVADADVSIYPYMDMGSGQGHSTSFTDPVATADGAYMGNITYNMSGTWTTTVSVITAQNDTLPDVVFEYNVQAK